MLFGGIFIAGAMGHVDRTGTMAGYAGFQRGAHSSGLLKINHGREGDVRTSA